MLTYKNYPSSSTSTYLLMPFQSPHFQELSEFLHLHILYLLVAAFLNSSLPRTILVPPLLYICCRLSKFLTSENYPSSSACIYLLPPSQNPYFQELSFFLHLYIYICCCLFKVLTSKNYASSSTGTYLLMPFQSPHFKELSEFLHIYIL